MSVLIILHIYVNYINFYHVKSLKFDPVLMMLHWANRKYITFFWVTLYLSLQKFRNVFHWNIMLTLKLSILFDMAVIWKKNVNKNWCIWLWPFSRHCGRLLCSKCSAKDMPIIKYNLSKPVRVCEMCFDVLSLGGTF